MSFLLIQQLDHLDLKVDKLIDGYRRSGQIPDDSRVEAALSLVDNSLIREWLLEAGMTTTEIEALRNEALLGVMRRDALFGWLQFGVRKFVFSTHNDPEENGELIAAWAADREPGDNEENSS